MRTFWLREIQRVRGRDCPPRPDAGARARRHKAHTLGRGEKHHSAVERHDDPHLQPLVPARAFRPLARDRPFLRNPRLQGMPYRGPVSSARRSGRHQEAPVARAHGRMDQRRPRGAVGDRRASAGASRPLSAAQYRWPDLVRHVARYQPAELGFALVQVLRRRRLATELRSPGARRHLAARIPLRKISRGSFTSRRGFRRRRRTSPISSPATTSGWRSAKRPNG